MRSTFLQTMFGTIIETSDLQRKAFNQAFKKNNLNKYYTIDVKGLIGDDTNGHIDNLVRIYDDKILYMLSLIHI